MFDKLLVCTDGSEDSVRAARTAKEIAAKFSGAVTVLSVYFPSPMLASFGEAPEAAACIDALLSIGDAQHEGALGVVRPVFEQAGITIAEIKEFGHPVETIVSTAETMGADLIVMGSRGLSGLKSMLLGSVSDGVLHRAHCPVLIVR